MKKWVSGLFALRENNTNLKTEIIAGFTTFLTMSYIVFVNPNILKAAGMPFGAVMTATCLSAAVASILMGIYANLPIGLAPGMGTNAYFAFFVCGVMGVNWQTALGAVFISGFAFLILTITGLREKIIDAIPDSMKHAVAAGIGIFIAFVGLEGSGIIVKNDAVLVGLGMVSSPEVAVTLMGLVITGFFLAKKIRGALLWGILGTTLIAIAFGVAKAPSAIISMPPSIGPTFAAMDIKAAFGLGIVQIVFAFLFVDLFDTIATLIGVADEGGLMKNGKDGKLHLPRVGRALTADAVGTMVGAVLGTSTTTSYIESTTGIAEGGRTGLTAVVVGLLFIVMLFFSPIIGIVPPQATAPILIIVCVFMLKNLTKIAWNDYTEAIPAVVTCLGIPLTFSISNGLALGFILYPTLKIVTGRWREANWLVYVLGILFVLKFIFLET
ncbi:MAG: NCS2 family permease [Deltaproteobacteria bacterium]|mgnify:CR=1 FL=1|jgi:adenine/guanine/hypoxanthine permease|nr:NCS2 family permease [Deltaproteobacteria bacterium]